MKTLRIPLFILLFCLFLTIVSAAIITSVSNNEPTHAHNEVFLQRNSSGTIFVVYIDNKTSGIDVSDVYLAYSNNGTAWTSGINISNSAKVIDYPSFSLFANNNSFYLVYVENSTTKRNLTLKTCDNDCTNASNWINKTTIYQGGAERPELKQDSNGKLHLVFENYTAASSYGTVLYTQCSANCNNASNWLSPIRIDNNVAGYALQPALDIDSNNNLHAMWMDKINNTQWDLFYTTCSAASNCTDPNNWSNLNVTNRAGGDDDIVFVIGSNNVIHATYDNNEGEVEYINCSSSCTNRSKWSSPFNVSNSRPTKPGHSTISIDSANNLYILWHLEETAISGPDAGHIQYRKYTAQTSQWGNVQNITSDAINRYVTARPSTIYGNQESLDYIYTNGTSSSFYIIFNMSTIDVTPPNISLNTPSNGSSTTSLTIAFLYNVTDVNEIANCSLAINSINITQNLSYINKSISNNISYEFSSIGDYTWQISCKDVYNNMGNSSLRNLTITYIVIPPSDGGSDLCIPVWECSSWSTCSINNTQARTCTNQCSTTENKPIEQQSCINIPQQYLPAVQLGEIPSNAKLVQVEKGNLILLSPVECKKQEKNKVKIIRDFNVYQIKKQGKIDYKSIITLTVENHGNEPASNIELKEKIPEVILEDPSLKFNVEGVKINKDSLRYDIPYLDVEGKLSINYSVNRKINPVLLNNNFETTGFSVINAESPSTLLSSISSSKFSILWILFTIALLLSITITTIHWVRYGNLNTNAFNHSIILILPLMMLIFDFLLATYLILFALLPLSLLEVFIFIKRKMSYS